MRRIAFGISVISLIVAVGCGGTDSSEADPGPASTTTVIGASGGRVTGSGATIDIPPNAVSGDVMTTVAAADVSPPADVIVVGPAVDLGPEGQQFAVPVTVTLSIDPAKLPAGTTIADVSIYTAPRGSTSYTPLATRATGATQVAAETTHFSVFFPGVRTMSSTSGPCPAGASSSSLPTSMTLDFSTPVEQPWRFYYFTAGGRPEKPVLCLIAHWSKRGSGFSGTTARQKIAFTQTKPAEPGTNGWTALTGHFRGGFEIETKPYFTPAEYELDLYGANGCNLEEGERDVTNTNNVVSPQECGGAQPGYVPHPACATVTVACGQLPPRAVVTINMVPPR